MHNKIINLGVVAKVAEGLQELKEKMVFVGGAVISLYTDDPAADEIRPTGDIDMTINLANYSEWVEMQERLSELGFHPDSEGHSICSYLYEDIPVDIMPSEESTLGGSNRWYKPGFKFLQEIEISKDVYIKILPSPYFLATKFEAFKDRGKNDYYGSHDYEDIIYLLDNRLNIVEEVLSSEEDVKRYIQNELEVLRNHRHYEEILSIHIHPLFRDERFKMLLEKIDTILNS